MPRPRSRRRASTSPRPAPRGSLGRTLNFAAWTARHKGELDKAERLFRESIRILAPLEDRATLCETQRSLAELLLVQGRVDEAERFALAARETVGPHDITSLATTTMSLGLVRAAQGRDEEAEELLRQAYDTLAETELRQHPVRDSCRRSTQFLRDRGRDEEAAELDARREGVLGKKPAPPESPGSTRGRATRRSHSPSAGTSAAPA